MALISVVLISDLLSWGWRFWLVYDRPEMMRLGPYVRLFHKRNHLSTVFVLMLSDGYYYVTIHAGEWEQLRGRRQGGNLRHSLFHWGGSNYNDSVTGYCRTVIIMRRLTLSLFTVHWSGSRSYKMRMDPHILTHTCFLKTNWRSWLYFLVSCCYCCCSGSVPILHPLHMIFTAWRSHSSIVHLLHVASYPTMHHHQLCMQYASFLFRPLHLPLLNKAEEDRIICG